MPQTSQAILVVDDEADIRDAYPLMLRKEIQAGAYRFVFACDGEQALALLDRHPDISVALLDINMPGMDGLTFLGRVCQQAYIDQPYQFLKVIMVTAYGDMPNLRKALNFGAFDFIVKPFEVADIRATLNKALHETGKLRELYQRYKLEEQRRLNAEHQLGQIRVALQPIFSRRTML